MKQQREKTCLKKALMNAKRELARMVQNESCAMTIEAQQEYVNMLEYKMYERMGILY